MLVLITILGTMLNQPSEATLLKYLLKTDLKPSIVNGKTIRDQNLLPKRKPK